MYQLFDSLFDQYSQYETHDIFLEMFAVLFGLISVWYSKRNNILVFPTGMISTAIFVYLLFKWSLLGDMIINGYFFIMSIYGWYVWSRKKNEAFTPITSLTKKEVIPSVFIFFFSVIIVYLVYIYFDMWNSYTAYIDNLTTAIFFVGMWLMANRKIESWFFWILGDVISVPLYLYKGLTFTSLQYYTWKKILNRSIQVA